MSMIQEIKARMIQAMRDRDAPTKSILQVTLGDLELAETRQGGDLDDKQAAQIVRKILKSNQETLTLTKDPEKIEILKVEIVILEGLLPATLSVEQIVAALAPHLDAIKAPGNDGQATGVAMKNLKAAGAAVEGKDVSAAVRQIRGS